MEEKILRIIDHNFNFIDRTFERLDIDILNNKLAVDNIKRILKKHAKNNRKVVTFSLMLAAYTILTKIEQREQRRKINKLSREVEELKNSVKGE